MMEIAAIATTETQSLGAYQTARAPAHRAYQAIATLLPMLVAKGELRWEPDNEVDGDWDNQTLVGGKPGAWGIVCGNWGGKWHNEMLREHMDFDLKSSAGTILLLQEAKQELLEHLKKPGSDGIVKGHQGTHGDGGQGTSWEQRPTAQFWGFRGQQAKRDILICARISVVKGMRLLLYRVRHDGTYRKKPKNSKLNKNRPPVMKMAITTWMIVSCRMRFLRSATRTR